MQVKTNLTIEIETPDAEKMIVYPEEGQSDDDFEGTEKQKELQDFRKDFAKDLHERTIDWIKRFFVESDFEDRFIDDLDDLTVDGYDTLDDFGIKITVNQEDRNKAEVFVKHIENHLTKLIKEGKLNKDAKVMCKICEKDIEEIYKEKRGDGVNSSQR